MRVLFCGGGTAGHVTPAIAIAQTIMRNSRENKVAYVVTQNGIENKLVDLQLKNDKHRKSKGNYL